MKNLFLLYLFIIISCSKSPVDRVKEYEQVYNSHNIEKIISLHADDAVFVIFVSDTMKGKCLVLQLSSIAASLAIENPPCRLLHNQFFILYLRMQVSSNCLILLDMMRFLHSPE